MKIKLGRYKEKILVFFNGKKLAAVGCVLALGITCLLTVLVFLNVGVKGGKGKASGGFRVEDTLSYELIMKEIETTLEETVIPETTVEETTIPEITTEETEQKQEPEIEEITDPEEDYSNQTWFMLTDEGWAFVDESNIGGNISGYEQEQEPDIPVYEKSKAAEEKAIEIVGQIITPNMSEYEKVLAIHDYLCLNVQYDYDNYLNNTIPHESYTAEGALIYGRVVCNGYTDAFTYLCYEAGIDVERVQGLADNGTVNGAHAWNQVKIDGEWFNIDVTWDDPVGRDDSDYYRYDYFLLTDAEIEKDHTPQTYSEQHSCTSVRFKDEIRRLKVMRDLGDNYTFVSSNEEAMRAVEQYTSQGIYEYQIVYDVKNIDEVEQDKIMQRWWTQIEEYRQEKYPEMKWNCPIGHVEDYLIYEMSLME